MMRRADWRRLPTDPRSPLGWCYRELRRFSVSFLLVILVISAFGGLAFATGASWFSIFAAPTGGLLSWYLLQRLRRRHMPELQSLAPSPAPTEIFPIEFAIHFGNVCTGRDQGVATITDGWLYVEGLHTSFSFRPVDIVRTRALSGGSDCFDLPGGQRIEIRQLGSAADRATFQETIRLWHRFPFEIPRGEPMLPPLEVHGSASVRPLLIAAAAALALMVELGLFVYAIRLDFFTEVLIAIPIVIVAWQLRKSLDELRSLKGVTQRALGGEL